MVCYALWSRPSGNGNCDDFDAWLGGFANCDLKIGFLPEIRYNRLYLYRKKLELKIIASRFFTLGLLALAIGGCATTGRPADPNDPYEGYNRGVYEFNDGFYHYVATPINAIYTTALPQFVRTGVGNAFNNISTVPAMMNDALQWNWRYFVKDTLRLILNTTLGLFGLIDVAGESGIPAHEQGFSYTLAQWGWTNSNYFMLPFFGPGTVSSAFSLPVNYFMSPLTYIPEKASVSWTLWGLESVQTISEQLPSYNAINDSAVDPYIAIRNAYLQNRAYVIQQIKTDGVISDDSDSDSTQMSPALEMSLANS